MAAITADVDVHLLGARAAEGGRATRDAQSRERARSPRRSMTDAV
jgi:hypothetical protein